MRDEIIFFKPGDKLILNEGRGQEFTKGYSSIMVVSNDLKYNNVYAVYKNNNNGGLYLGASSVYFKYASPIWLSSKDNK